FCCGFILFRVIVCLCEQLGLFIVVLTSRSLQVQFFDQHCEAHIIQDEVDDSHRHDQQPARLRISLQDSEEEQIQKSARECQSYRDIQYMRDHVRGSRQDDLDHKQNRSCEQEGEFKRLRDSRQHTCQGCGEQKSS